MNKERLSLDKKETKEMQSEAREKLLFLEKENRYVFHGSPSLLGKLEPRQPFTSVKETGKEEKHGEPSIAATPFADIAIFRAIINPQNAPIKKYTSGFGYSGENLKYKLNFETTPETVEEVRDKFGYIYVFDKDLFEKFSDMEWRANKEMVPLQTIRVSFKDLPEFYEVPYRSKK